MILYLIKLILITNLETWKEAPKAATAP